MTDPNDLRRLLDELSDQTPEVPTQEWLAGTRHKMRVRRRARWAGASGAAALVLAAAVAVVPQVVDTADSEPTPVAPEPDGEAGWPFAAEMDTDRVIASRVNDPGASEFEWVTETKWPSDTAFMRFCRLPRKPEPGQPGIRVVATINGHRTVGWPCRYRNDYPPVHGSLVERDVSTGFGQRYDVEPNEPFTVVVWLERDGQPVEEPDAAFGIGFTSCHVPLNRASDGEAPDCVLNFPGPDMLVGGAILSR